MRSRRSTHDELTTVSLRRLGARQYETAPEDPGPPVGRHAHRSGSATLRLTGWLRDRLPPTLQGRIRLGAPQVAAVAVLAALALAATAWSTLRAADPGPLVPTAAMLSPAPGPLVPLASPDPGGDPAGHQPGDQPSGEVVVDVAGRVRSPGIARLPSGSRVVDALQAAGGARRGVDLRGLNLARLLVDGEQVLVGVRPVPGVAASAANAAAPPAPGQPLALVRLNTADQAGLETLPGVGPVTAQAILAWRTEHGAFAAVEELLDVSGIGEATLAQIAPLVTL